MGAYVGNDGTLGAEDVAVEESDYLVSQAAAIRAWAVVSARQRNVGGRSNMERRKWKSPVVSTFPKKKPRSSLDFWISSGDRLVVAGGSPLSIRGSLAPEPYRVESREFVR